MTKVPQRTKLSDHVAARSEVDRMAAFLTQFIVIVGLIVFFVFTAISIRDIRFDNIPVFFGVTTFTKFGLGLFFAHWSWGVKTDLFLQSNYYQATPDGGKLTLRSKIGIAGFIAFFVALFWWHTEPVTFQLILLGFICMNFYSWGAIIAQSNRMARSSRKQLRADGDWFALEQLELVCHYMNGRWQVIRFGVLIVLAVVQLFVALALAGWWDALARARQGLEQLFGASLLPHVPGLLFFLYVLVSSAWMGAMRLRVLSGTKVVNDLLEKYVMERRAPARRRGPAAKPT
jgi:hypothetical protein